VIKLWNILGIARRAYLKVKKIIKLKKQGRELDNLCNDSQSSLVWGDFEVNKSDSYYMSLSQKIREGVRRGGRPGTNELLESIPLVRGNKVLDVGFGTGEASTYFAEKGCEVTSIGVDIDNYTSKSKLNKNIKVVEGFLEMWTFMIQLLI
jgi:2-polyprenyl-3-methyl-5-hydroxy-6-metoxy-1,4-benzoquinol methylase